MTKDVINDELRLCVWKQNETTLMEHNFSHKNETKEKEKYEEC